MSRRSRSLSVSIPSTISLDDLHLLLALFIILWLNAGNSTFVVDKIPSSVKFGIALLWFIYALMKNQVYFNKFINVSIPMIFFITIMVLTQLMGGSDYYQLYFQSFIYILMIIALSSYYFYFGKIYEIKTILFVFVADISIVTIRTFIELLRNPIIARAMSTGAGLKQTLLGSDIPKGIGGYGLCYATVFYMALLLMVKDLWHGHYIIRFMVCIFVLLFLFEAQLTIALILFIIVWMASIITTSTKTSVQIIVKLCGLLIILLFVLNITSILEWAIQLADTSLAVRLREMLDMLQSSGATTGNDTNVRITLYTYSLNSFISSPFLGSLGRRAYGCHSSLFDMFAAFGILGFTGIYGIIKPLLMSRKYFKIRGDLLSTRYLSFIIVVYLLFSCINISHRSEIMLVLLLITPLTLKLREKNIWKLKNESNPD